MNCWQCKFWNCEPYCRKEHFRFVVNHCRRHSPIPRFRTELDESEATWPRTKGGDYCGDFEMFLEAKE